MGEKRHVQSTADLGLLIVWQADQERHLEYLQRSIEGFNSRMADSCRHKGPNFKFFAHIGFWSFLESNIGQIFYNATSV